MCDVRSARDLPGWALRARLRQAAPSGKVRFARPTGLASITCDRSEPHASPCARDASDTPNSAASSLEASDQFAAWPIDDGYSCYNVVSAKIFGLVVDERISSSLLSFRNDEIVAIDPTK